MSDNHYIDPITRVFYSASQLFSSFDTSEGPYTYLVDAADLIAKSKPEIEDYLRDRQMIIDGGPVAEVFNWVGQVSRIPEPNSEVGIKRILAVSAALPPINDGRSDNDDLKYLLNSIMSINSEHRTALMQESAATRLLKMVRNVPYCNYRYGAK